MKRSFSHWLVSLLLFCVGCAAKIPPTNYYVLGLPIQTPEAGQSALPFSVSIGRFEQQPPFDRRNLVWKEGNEVGFYNYEKWADLPGRLFSYRLYRRADESGLFQKVTLGTSGGQTDYTIKGVLLDFEEVIGADGNFGVVAVEADLVNAEGESLWNGTIKKQVTVHGEDGKAAVQAITQAAEETISSLLSEVTDALSQQTSSANH